MSIIFYNKLVCHHAVSSKLLTLKFYFSLAMIGKAIVALALLVAGAGYYMSGKSLQTITVTCKSGSLTGVVRQSRDGRNYYSWRAIPYAKPPLGELRFQGRQRFGIDPQPVGIWEGVRDGTQDGPSCPQMHLLFKSYAGEEDCLFLNVNTPKIGNEELTAQKRLPVIVYIHPGAYVLGDGMTMVGADYFMDQDVVLVTVNHRLGILGFLTTGDLTIRGNMGLKDQIQALKWIKENIEHFGGDPEQVTIFGTSAGAASVHMHTLSPLSKGLFKRAIAQSGAASNQWALNTMEESLKNLEKFGRELGCPTYKKQHLVDCLRKADVKELIEADYKLFTSKMPVFVPHQDGMGFVPTIEAVNDEKSFITKHPLHAIKEGKVQNVPILWGHTPGEGITAAVVLRENPEALAEFETKWEDRTRQLFQLAANTPSETVCKIYEFYIPKSIQSTERLEERLQNYTAFLSDAFFIYDLQEAVNLQRKFAPVYTYVYTKKDTSPMMTALYEIPPNWPRWLGVPYALLETILNHHVLGYPLESYGVDHAADLALLFPMASFMYIGKDDALYELSKDHVKMLVDFSRDDTNVVVRGTKLQRQHKDGPLHFMEINDQTRIINNPTENRFNFLSSLNIRGLN